MVSTGALMSTTTSQQGDTIPGIAHAIELVYESNSTEKENKTNSNKANNGNKKTSKSISNSSKHRKTSTNKRRLV